METESELVTEMENRPMITTCPESLDGFPHGVFLKGIDNRGLSSALYSFANMDDKIGETKVEPITPKESTSRALVPVTSEIKFHENGVISPNVFDYMYNLMIKEIKWKPLLVSSPIISDAPKEFNDNFYSNNSTIDRKIRLRNKRSDSSRRSLQLVKRPGISEQMCQAWGKCKARIQEHRMRLAASTNNVETVEQLLNAGISPNNQDLRGRSPLHLSACRGYTEIVRILLQHNADPNRQDCIGNTPLHLATLTNKVPVVTLLLEAGAKVNTLDFRGFTPLYLAQTRLRLLQMCKCNDMTEVEKQMFEIVNMLRVYLKKLPSSNESSNWNAQMEKINDICSKLSLSTTSKPVEVQDEVRSLLSSIEALNLS